MKLKLLVPVVLTLAAIATPRAEIIEQILVKVNGEIFTKTDLEARQVSEIRQRGKQLDLSTPAGNEELRKAIAEVTPALLVSVVDEMLIVQRGKEDRETARQTAQFMLITHDTLEPSIRKAIERIEKDGHVAGAPRVIRIARL